MKESACPIDDHGQSRKKNRTTRETHLRNFLPTFYWTERRYHISTAHKSVSASVRTSSTAEEALEPQSWEADRGRWWYELKLDL